MAPRRIAIKVSDEEYSMICAIRRVIHTKGLDWVNGRIGYELFTEDDFYNGRVTNMAIIGKCTFYLYARLMLKGAK